MPRCYRMLTFSAQSHRACQNNHWCLSCGYSSYDFTGGTISVMFWYFMMKLLPHGLQAEHLGLVFLISRDLTFVIKAIWQCFGNQFCDFHKVKIRDLTARTKVQVKQIKRLAAGACTSQRYIRSYFFALVLHKGGVVHKQLYQCAFVRLAYICNSVAHIMESCAEILSSIFIANSVI